MDELNQYLTAEMLKRYNENQKEAIMERLLFTNFVMNEFIKNQVDKQALEACVELNKLFIDLYKKIEFDTIKR